MKFLLDVSGSHLRIAKFDKRLKLIEKIDWKNYSCKKRKELIYGIRDYLKEKYGFDKRKKLLISYAGYRIKSKSNKIFLPNANLEIDLNKLNAIGENDLNLVALAYDHHEDVVALGIGTGIGLGIFKQRPFFGNIGEIGHIILHNNKKIITLEDIITKPFHDTKIEDLQNKELKKYLKHFVFMIDGIIKVFNPNVLVLHGTLSLKLLSYLTVKRLKEKIIELNKKLKYPLKLPKIICSNEMDVFYGLLKLKKYEKFLPK